MGSEGLLGNLPSEWRMELDQYIVGKFGCSPVYTNSLTGKTILEDPRLGSLTEGWTLESGDILGGYRTPQFRNVETGEITNFDPRLEIGALKARGCNIERFRLI